MRAWLPERQVYGPTRADARDIEGLNRVFVEEAVAVVRHDDHVAFFRHLG